MPDANGDPLAAVAYQALEHALTTVSRDLDDLAERVAAIEEALTQPAADRISGTPVVWHELDPAEAAALWPRFIDWVTWLADTYALSVSQLPRCWPQHGSVVAELTDLWTGYRSAHDTARGDAGSAPYLWGDALARALERITHTWAGDCKTGEHQHPSRRPWRDDNDYLRQLTAAQPTPTATKQNMSGPDDTEVTQMQIRLEDRHDDGTGGIHP
jgi:hypothetical protein